MLLYFSAKGIFALLVLTGLVLSSRRRRGAGWWLMLAGVLPIAVEGVLMLLQYKDGITVGRLAGGSVAAFVFLVYGLPLLGWLVFAGGLASYVVMGAGARERVCELESIHASLTEQIRKEKSRREQSSSGDCHESLNRLT